MAIEDLVPAVLVFGSRSLKDYSLVKEKLDYYIGDRKVLIISGGAKGADQLGERWAEERGLEVKRFLPNYDQHGEQAPLIRNQTMAEFVSLDGFAIGFWDGQSGGTYHMWGCLKMNGMKTSRIRIVRFNDGK